MDNLLNDGDTSNDYLDVYVKALYPEFYGNVDTLTASSDYTGGCNDYKGISKYRQCRAMVQFYIHYILEKGWLCGTDSDIQSTKWLTFDDADNNCVADNDYIMQVGEGTLIYHSSDSFGSSCGSGDYLYNPSTNTVSRGSGNLTDYVVQGDIFVDNYYGHYGLIYDGNNVLDANWGLDGKIHKALSDTRGTDNWKVARPQ